MALSEIEALGPGLTMPGADLFRGSARLGELDLLGYAGRHLIAGEAKLSPGSFTGAELSHLRRLAEEVQADRVVIACPDRLSDDQRAAVEGEFRDIAWQEVNAT